VDGGVFQVDARVADNVGLLWQKILHAGTGIKSQSIVVSYDPQAAQLRTQSPSPLGAVESPSIRQQPQQDSRQ
jgi:hypothetical protein